MSHPAPSDFNRELPWGKCGLVVVAAGESSRFGASKQLALVDGQPLLERTLAAFTPVPFSERVLVVPQAWLDEGRGAVLARIPEAERFHLVAGGSTRARSVFNGVVKISEACDLVVVHDGARPFPPLDAMSRCIAALQSNPDLGGAVVGREVTDTIKLVDGDGMILETVPRRELRAVETPQVARRDLLLQALFGDLADGFTDDMEALEHHGHATTVEVHHGVNLKVTRPHDLIIAEAILAARILEGKNP
ncbi:MAG: 2-C-methyl-D-erythritol 4-phosphate cytidylyltransferase [Candidatus Sumerlaeia bacterium]|nr:2-C-methyl-D-erythritol 4-phosphate cytidylyltransferase [Candidatus Sumerlaeia bacterium]